MNLKKGEWRDRSGKVWKISQMPSPYIANSIKYLRKKQEELIDAIGADAEQAEEYLEITGKILELTDEYLSRQKKYFDNPNAPVKKEPTLEEVIESLSDDTGVQINESFAVTYRKKYKKGGT